MRGREHTPRLKAVNRVLAALIERDTCLGSRLSGGAARGGAVCAARAGARAQAAPPPPTGGHEACQQRAGRSRARGSRALCGGCGRTHVCSMGWGAPSRVASRRRSSSRRRFGQAQGLLTSGPFLAAGARAERYITPLRYTLCARGLFPFGQRGELLALGNLDISGAAALALPPAVRCKRPPSCRLFPTNSASVRRNPTCTGNAARGGRLCVTTQRLERTGHGHTGAQDDSARRRKALLQLPSAVLCRGCHALAQHCAQREERTGTDLATT